ncbi:hypothetical protein HID58_072184 [Brassica napus]|uniref:Uncharacterized protein n=1 Tax=Brassica napus TaxID=3708 RepID=A0ABQ7Z3Z3_BRANA|nr:hypothetical protein HID58_072184 [Brassica napus]
MYKARAGMVPIREVPNPLYNPFKPSCLTRVNAPLIHEP